MLDATRVSSVSRAVGGALRLFAALGPVGAVGAALLAPAHASAQVKDVAPREVTVTSDSASLRSGAGEVWYVVGQARSGDVLTVDGESFGWYRVKYPQGTPAMVVASEGTLDSGRGVVRLTGPSKLFAYAVGASTQNAQAVQASWKVLLTQPLAPGTELRHRQTLSDAAGRPVAYLVSAPDGARAFVNSQAVREATAEEKARASAVNAPVAEAPPAATNPTPAPTQAPVSQPPTVVSTPPADSVAPAESQPAPVSITMTPAPSPNTARPDLSDVGGDPIGRRIARFDELEPKYRKVIGEPVEGSELLPLISEYTRLEQSLGDSPEDAAMRPAVQSRLNLLQIRADLQKDFQKLAALESKAKTDVTAIGESIRAYQASKPYSVVGRLSASTIYDGNKLPLMFRLQSVEGDVGRTLAYVVAGKGVDVMGKLGLLVGVEGDSRRDPALRLDIIEARRVDVLQSADQAAPSGAPAASPGSAPAQPERQTAGEESDGG